MNHVTRIRKLNLEDELLVSEVRALLGNEIADLTLVTVDSLRSDENFDLT